MTETLVVGLDAACWERLDPLLEAGDLPNLEALLTDGVEGDLQSTSPPMTPPAWTSMVTGVNPAEHGVQDFLRMDPGTHEISPAGEIDLPVPAIWDVFGAADKRIAMLNFPMIYPPPAVDGWFVSGIPHAVHEGVAHPDAVQSELENGTYQITPTADPSSPGEYLEALEAIVDARAELTLRTINDANADLVWSVFMAIDWVQHYLWDMEVDGADAVDEIHRHIDERIGDLLAAIDDDTDVIVVSDHGATPIDHEIHLDTLLDQMKFLEQAERGSSASVSRTASKLALSVASRLPRPIKNALKRSVSSDRHERLQRAAGRGQFSLHDEINWEETSVFAYGYMGQLYVNRSDWYGHGTVEPDAYEAVRSDVVERFEGIDHPETGQPLIDAARTADEVYGNRGPSIPDVLLEPVDWNAMMYGDFADEWLQPPTDRIADHEPAGIFIASGPSFEPGKIELDAVDVGPMIMHLHGLAVPSSTTGIVHTSIFASDGPVSTEVLREPMDDLTAVSHDDRTTEKEVEDRLEDLGYL